MTYNFNNKTKQFLFILIILGFIATLIGFLSEKSHFYTSVIDEHKVAVEYPHHFSAEKTSNLQSKIKELASHHGFEVTITEEHPEYKYETEELKEHHPYEGVYWILDVKKAHDEHGDEHAKKPLPGVGHHGGHGEHHHSDAEEFSHLIHHHIHFADTHHARFWSNLLVNGLFFFGIALGALFFIALQYATESGWAVTMKRIFESISLALPVGAVIIIIVVIAGIMNWHHIYHWMHPGPILETDTATWQVDEIIKGKSSFLNIPFFLIRVLGFIALYFIFARAFRKRSLSSDQDDSNLAIHKKNFSKSAFFLVLFGFTSSVLSWDLVMSIDTHWFSTLFGWYVFSGFWVSSIIFTLMLILFLKRKGYLNFVNESHIHDMGKWMFAVSVLWAYLFFSQYMLIWYSDIPEETTYFIDRLESSYEGIYVLMFAVNLVLPLIFLMSREAKRTSGILLTIGSIIFIGHWVDFFLMVMPGSVYSHWNIGLLEIGMFILFLGIFIYTVLNSLKKAPLLVKNHPYLEESLHQDT